MHSSVNILKRTVAFFGFFDQRLKPGKRLVESFFELFWQTQTTELSVQTQTVLHIHIPAKNTIKLFNASVLEYYTFKRKKRREKKSREKTSQKHEHKGNLAVAV